MFNPALEHLMANYLGEQSVYRAMILSEQWVGCCLVYGRKEEDELSLWYSTESLCVTLFGVERKRVAALSHWLLSQWKGNRVSRVPTGFNQKGWSTSRWLCVFTGQVWWPMLHPKLFKKPNRELFLEPPLLCTGVRLSAEAMWQMINFSGRLEAWGGRGGGVWFG